MLRKKCSPGSKSSTPGAAVPAERHTGVRRHPDGSQGARTAQRLDALTQLRDQGELGKLSGLLWKLRGGNIVHCSGYVRPSLGVAGINVERMQAWMSFLASPFLTRCPILCDWSMKPEELQSSGLLDTLAEAGPQILVLDDPVTSISGWGQDLPLRARVGLGGGFDAEAAGGSWPVAVP